MQSGIEDVLPLAPLQQGLLFHALYDEHAPDAYVVQVALQLDGVLDQTALQQAGDALLRRHPNLRAAFLHQGVKEPLQVIQREVRMPWQLLELSSMPSSQRDAQVAAFLEHDSTERFTLARAPLMRCALLRLSGTRHLLVFTFHHLLLDGWSLPILIQELFELYHRKGSDATLPRVVPYRDFLTWLAQQDRTTAQQAWRQVLDGLEEPTCLAPSRPPVAAPALTVDIEFSTELSERLTRQAREHSLTLNTLLQGAWALLLSRLTGRRDIVFGTTVSGRSGELAGIERVVGLLINTVPVRVQLRPEESAIATLRSLQDRQSRLIAHQHFGLAEIQRDTGIGELFDTLLGFENYPMPADMLDPGEEELSVSIWRSQGGNTSHYPLSVIVVPRDRLLLRLGYRPDVFERPAVQTLGERLQRVLEAMAADLQQPLASIDILSAKERRQILQLWNHTERAFPNQDAVSLFQAQVERSPHATALVFQGHSLSYGELNARANLLAQHLLQRSVRPEQPVAILLERSFELIIATLATLKARAAYVPLNPRHPHSQLLQLLQQLQPAVLITSQALHRSAFQDHAPALLLDSLALHPGSQLNPPRRCQPHQLACIMYTSGSTGQPKGIALTHANLVKLAFDSRCRPTSPQRTLLHSSQAFDAYSVELWIPLLGGHQIHIAPNEQLDARALGDFISQHRITTLFLTAGLLQPMAEECPERFANVQHLLTGGDVVSVNATHKLLSHCPTLRITNGYGPSEISVFASFHQIRPEDLNLNALPIGTALDNTQLFVLDANLQPVPTGVVAELYIGGKGLARGYLSPAQTAERFIANPFLPGTRLYRSGDLVRWREDGLLEFIARTDHQIKLRGFRIELGEIEAALLQAPAIAQALVMARADRPGHKQLIAYLLPRPGAELNLQELRSTLARQLPEYMLPAAFVILNSMPLTLNGKIDRRALPAPDFSPRSNSQPRNSHERILADLFAEILCLQSVGIEDNFFLMGGDSISSIQLAGRARKAGLSITPRQIFQHQSVRALAAIATVATSRAAPRRAGDNTGIGAVPLTPILHKFFALGAPASFFQHVVLNVPAGLVLPDLTSALQALLDHHDVLRLKTQGRSITVLPRGALAAADCITHVAADPNSTPLEHYIELARRQLDPSTAALLRAVWLDADVAAPGTLILLIHHLAVDSVSWRILLSDLQAAWQSRHEPARALQPIVTSFREWAHLLLEEAGKPSRVKELPLWQQAMQGDGARLAIPALDQQIDTLRTSRSLEVRLPSAATAILLTRPPALFHAQINDVLLTAFALCYAHWHRTVWNASATAVCLELEGHGREELFAHVDLSRTIGWFTSVFPVRLDLSTLDTPRALAGGAELGQLLKHVKEQLRAIPDKGIGFGLLRYLNSDTAADLQQPDPQICFNYLGRFAVDGSTGADWTLRDDADVIGGGGAPETPLTHAITLNVVVSDDAEGPHLRACLTWATRLLDTAQMQLLADAWMQALNALVIHCNDPLAGGLSPSDLPLVAIDQGSIDRLQQHIADIEDILPLTGLQQGLLFHAVYDEQQRDTYVSQITLELTGPLDSLRLQQATEEVLRRHPNLRAGFVHHGVPQPLQVIRRQVLVPWQTFDLSDLPMAEQQRSVSTFLHEDRSTRFDLAQPPLVRCTLLRLGAEQHHFVLTHHHILLDGWSIPILLKELLALYRSGQSAPLTSGAAYAQYLQWLGEQDRVAAATAWQSMLAGLEGPTRVADPDAGSTSLADTIAFELQPSLSDALTALARRHSLTLNTLVQCAWAVLLSRLTGRSDVVFGTIVSGRSADVPGVESLVGLLINTVPVRVQLPPAARLLDVMQQLQEQQSQLLAHDYLGLAEIQRSAGLGELFDTLMVFENYPEENSALSHTDDVLQARYSTLAGSSTWVDPTSHYPLGFWAIPGPRIQLRIGYQPRLFERAEAQLLVARIVRLFEQIAARPEQMIGRIDLLDPLEHEQILERSRGQPRSCPPISVVELFHQQVQRTHDSIAVITEAESLTYAQLDARAQRLALHLLDAGVKPGETVALALPRSADVIVALLAVLKAGAAYLPLDIEQPVERQHAIIADARPCLLVTTNAWASNSPHTLPSIRMDDPAIQQRRAVGADDGDRSRLPRIDTASLAYIVYTSGSTGQPKGVMVEHRNLVGYASSAAARLELIGPPRRFALMSGFATDLGHTVLFGALLFGHALRVLTREQVSDAALFAEILRRDGIDTLKCAPSHLQALLGDASHPQSPPVKHVILGGETADWELIDRIRALSTEGKVFNHYGPSETTVGAIATRVDSIAATDRRQVPPLGHPLDGAQAYILDNNLQPAAGGVTGELYIAGSGVARGYLHRPALTAERFVACPYSESGARCYRTGDLARWNSAGMIEFIGRGDHQVKIRGFRVELGEVERALLAQAEVMQARVIAREDRPRQKRLVGYVVPVPGAIPDVDRLLQSLSLQLPDYMLPSAIVVMSQLPLTANGKLDRNALPAPEVSQQTAVREPGTPTERLLSKLFAEILSLPQVSMQDSFLKLGGDSISAIQLVSRARYAGMVISPRQVMQLQTVEALAAAATPVLQQQAPAESKPAVLSDSLLQSVRALRPDVIELLPLAPLQEGLLFHTLYDEHTPDWYLVQVTFKVTGALDSSRLQAAALAVLQRHPNLRAGFAHAGVDQPIQFIPATVRLPWREIDLSSCVATAQATSLELILSEDRAHRFTLDEPPLLRFTLIRLAPDQHFVLLTKHHLLLDGWSMPLLLDELFALYRTGADASALLPVVPYRDHLDWIRQQDTGAARAAWQAALLGLQEPTRIVAERDSSAALVQTLVIDLPAALTEQLVEKARCHMLTLNTLVQGVWGLLLAKLTNRDDVVFGITVSGRSSELANAERIIGLLINTVPARVRLHPAVPFVAALQQLQNQQAELIAHQHLSLPEIQRIAGLGALFDTLLVFENFPIDQAALAQPTDELRIDYDVTHGGGTSHYPLSLCVVPWESLQLRLGYRPDVFSQARAQQIASQLLRLFETVARNCEQPVRQFTLLSEPERQRVLVDWNRTTQPLPAQDLATLFETQVRRTAGATALVSCRTRLSYSELNERVNVLAHRLIARGICRERSVGILLPRSIELVISILAVIKAGGTFVPLDPDHPPARLQCLLRQVEPALLIDAADSHGIAVHLGVPMLSIDAAPLSQEPAITTNPNVHCQPQQLAYIMFTSGSSGEPKGVAVTHANVAKLALDRRWRDGSQQRVLLNASPAFDASTYELWVPLLNGFELHIARSDSDAHSLAQMLVQHDITALWITAGLFQVMVQEHAEAFARVRQVLAGGDVVSADAVRTLLGRCPGLCVTNGYGPTEITTFAASHSMLATDPIGSNVPIGSPLDNTQLYVLDAALEPVPIGVAGELYIAGAGLARGYLQRPALTAERFLANPFASSQRMYRTGDLVRWRSEGSLEFLGRTDQQVKIRGFRIELPEIETALLAQPAIAQALVIAQQLPNAHKQLVAYLVPAPNLSIELQPLRETLASQLPDYMLPAAFLILPALPLTPNGKLDRNALPAPQRCLTEPTQPHNPHEQLLATLFAELLCLPSVGIDESFFVLGGDSISSIQLVSRARKAGLLITPQDVFEQQSVAKLASTARAVAESQASSISPIGPIPLTPIMHWFVACGASSDLQQSALLKVPANLRLEDLQASLQTLLDHHDALRLRLMLDQESVARAEILPRGRISAADCLRQVHCTDPEREAPAASGAGLLEETRMAQGRLDPAAARMLAAVWFDAGARQDGTLLLMLHHLAVDGVSWSILLPDLESAWRAHVRGEQPVLPPVGTSLREWALRLQEIAPSRASELPTWTKPRAHDCRLQRLTHQRSAMPPRRLDLSLDVATTRELLMLATQIARGSIRDVLLTAFALTLLDWGEPHDRGYRRAVRFDVEGHGRESLFAGADLARTVGWFTTVFPLQLDFTDLAVPGSSTTQHLYSAFEHVRAQLSALPDHGAGYGLLRYLVPATRAALEAAGGSEVLFNYLGRFTSHSGKDWQDQAAVPLLSQQRSAAAATPYKIVLNGLVLEGSAGPALCASWDCLDAAIPEEQMMDLAQTWFGTLRALIRCAHSAGSAALTPSDVPLVSLSQTELDYVENLYAPEN